MSKSPLRQYESNSVAGWDHFKSGIFIYVGSIALDSKIQPPTIGFTGAIAP